MRLGLQAHAHSMSPAIAFHCMATAGSQQVMQHELHDDEPLNNKQLQWAILMPKGRGLHSDREMHRNQLFENSENSFLYVWMVLRPLYLCQIRDF